MNVEKAAWSRLVDNYAKAREALAKIADRSFRDDLGTSKVIDMREIAIRFLGQPIKETIVGVAVRYPAPDLSELPMLPTPYGDTITVSAPAPFRHFHLLHPLAIAGIEISPDDQGFITSVGRYVGREEALDIVLKSGQPMTGEPRAGMLFSEDVW